jgi:hypothetical protein
LTILKIRETSYDHGLPDAVEISTYLVQVVARERRTDSTSAALSSPPLVANYEKSWRRVMRFSGGEMQEQVALAMRILTCKGNAWSVIGKMRWQGSGQTDALQRRTESGLGLPVLG